VLLDGVRRREHVQRPWLAMRLQEIEKFQRALLVQQEILVHHEERGGAQLPLRLAHDPEQVLAALEEIDELAFSAKELRGRAEVASHWTADRWNDGRRGIPATIRQRDSHQSETERGGNDRVFDRPVDWFAEKPPQPCNPFPFDDVISIDQALDSRNR